MDKEKEVWKIRKITLFGEKGEVLSSHDVAINMYPNMELVVTWNFEKVRIPPGISIGGPSRDNGLNGRHYTKLDVPPIALTEQQQEDPE